MSKGRLLTVGHSNRRDTEFVELLRQHGVTAVADARSQPYSRRLPHFNREVLKELLSASEVKQAAEVAFVEKELAPINPEGASDD